MLINDHDSAFCSHESDTRRQKVYTKMLDKAMDLKYGSLHAFLVDHYQVQAKTWEAIANMLDVSGGTVQRATETLRIWRPIKRNRQKRWMLSLLIGLSTLLLACGSHFRQIKTDIQPQLQYESFVEKGFCMTQSGEVHNVLPGGAMSSPMPLCNRADIVMHTHPCWAERMANFADFHVWDIYHARYGNDLYGVSGDGWIKIYVWEKEN
jgi:hypothetical protein